MAKESRPPRDKALLEAIKRAGNSRRLAELLGVTPQSLSGWDVVPIKRAPEVERVTGIPRHELRPDFWSPPQAAAE